MAGGTRQDSSYGSFSTKTKTLIHLLPKALGRYPMPGVWGPGALGFWPISQPGQNSSAHRATRY